MTRDWVHGVGHSPVCQILLQIVTRTLLTPADFPFFSDDLLSLWLQFVQYDLQHDLAWAAHRADRSVDLALLKVVFLGKSGDQGLGPQDWPFSCLPDRVAA